MAFKEVASLDADTTIAIGKTDKKTGKAYPTQAEGYYLGSRTVEGSRGPSTLHFLQTPKGNLGVWGTTDLNRKLNRVKPGVMVRITSTGTKPTPKGDMFTYRVQDDNDNTIDVGGLTDSPTTAYADEDDVDTTSEITEEEVEVELAATSAVAARKAQVDAILNARKNKTK